MDADSGSGIRHPNSILFYHHKYILSRLEGVVWDHLKDTWKILRDSWRILWSPS